MRNAIYNGLADLLTLAAATVSSLALTRVLGPSAWGEYSQLTWLADTAALFLSGGLTYTAIRYLGSYSSGGQSSDTRRLVVWMTALQVAAVAAGMTAFATIGPAVVGSAGWHTRPQLVRIAGLATASLTMFQLVRSMLVGLQEYRGLALLSGFAALGTLVTLLVIMLEPSVDAVLAMTAAVRLLLLPLGCMAVWRGTEGSRTPRASDRAQWWSPPRDWQALARYSATVFVTVLVGQLVWQRSEMFWLGRLSEPVESGYYGIAFTIVAVALGTVPKALTGTLTPLFASQADVEGSQSVSRSYTESVSLLSLILFPLACGLFALAPDVLLWLYGEAYASAASALRWLVVSTVIGVWALPSASVLHALRRPIVLFVAITLAAPLDLGLAAFLVPAWKARGAAMANLAGSLVNGIVLVVTATRFARLRYDFRCIARRACAAVACGGGAWLCSRFLSGSGLRVLVGVATGGATYALALTCCRDPVVRQLWDWSLQRLPECGTDARSK